MAGDSTDVLTNEDDVKGRGGEGPPRRTPRLARKGLGARILLLTHAAEDKFCCVL